MTRWWAYYRICPVCDKIVGRGAKTGRLAIHCNEFVSNCPGSKIPWKDFPRPTEAQIARWRKRTKKKFPELNL